MSRTATGHGQSGGVATVRAETPSGGKGEKGQWNNQLEFLLTCVGFSVGLGNVWRFPYLTYQNGGGAFLIPYTIALFLIGLPMYCMELCLGQFSSLGPITVWRMNPLFKGLGYASGVVSWYIVLYFNVIISWCLYFVFSSMNSTLPWTSCDNEWNTPECRVPNKNFSFAETNFTTPTGEFFYNHVLDMSNGVGEAGLVRWQLLLLLLVSWIIIFLVLLKGIDSLGKVSYVISILPYILLTVMLIRAATLPGAKEGITFYISPTWEKLSDLKVWGAAVSQIFYSTGVCMGALIAMSSYNRFSNNAMRDGLIIPVINCLTSLYAGFVIFSVLGYMADQRGVDVSEVAAEGPGLVFVVYPEGLSTMPLPQLWSVLFFIMMTLIGYSSQFSSSEGIISALMDEFPSTLRVGNRPLVFRFVFCVVGFFLGIPMITQGGFYIFTIMDQFSTSFPLLSIAICELVAINYVYGFNRYSEDITLMLGVRPNIFMKVTWCFVSPLLVISTIIFLAVQYETLKLEDYIFPSWSMSLAWMIAMFPISLILLVGFVEYCRMGGWQALKSATYPDAAWGPANPVNRKGRYAVEDIINEQLSLEHRDSLQGNDNWSFIFPDQVEGILLRVPSFASKSSTSEYLQHS